MTKFLNIKNLKLKSSGQVFLLSLLILSAVMISALFLMSIFIKDIRQTTETSESVKAFYAADTAVEWQIYNTLNDPDIERPVMNNSTDFEWQNDYSTTGNIKAAGSSKNVKRGLEVHF